MSELIDYVVSFRTRATLLDGVKLPSEDYIKCICDWTLIRHGHLLNEYMRWCNEHKGTKQEFAVNLVKEIAEGKHPILVKDAAYDRDDIPFTANSIMAQLDWMAQKENQVIVSVPNSTVKMFYPTNLMIMTSYQKSAEARRAAAKAEAAIPDAPEGTMSTEESLADLIVEMLKANPDILKKAIDVLE